MGNGWFSSSLRETNTFHFYRGWVLVKVLGEWLVVVRCDADDVCLEQVLRKSSV